MEEDPGKVSSTQKTLSSFHDPGWNDPPSWALQKAANAAAAGTPTKRLLNKRVAFPINSTTSTPIMQNMPPMGNLPPPPQFTQLSTAPHKPTLAPTGIGTSSNLTIDAGNNENQQY